MFATQGDLTVRPVEPEDEDFVYALFCSVRAIELAHANLSAAEREHFLRTQFRAMHDTYAMRFPNGEHFIVVSRGRDIGRIYVNETDDEIRLLDVIIQPKDRNRGIGSRLIQQMIEQGSMSAKTIRFYVWQTNDAGQRFYERHGFEQVRNENAYLLYELQPSR